MSFDLTLLRRRKRINQCLLLLLTIAIATACASTATNQDKTPTTKTCSSDFRLIQHELEEVCVPNNAQLYFRIFTPREAFGF